MPQIYTDINPEDDLHPPPQSICKVLRRNGNWKCFMLSLMIIGCLSSIIWCTVTHKHQDSIDHNNMSLPGNKTICKFACDVGYIYISIVFLALLYLIHLFECYHCTIRIQLSKKVDLTAVSARIHAMTTAVPRVWWKAICYHYVRRKRQVLRNRHGNPYATTQVYYERLNTHCANTYFAQECCGQKDASKRLVFNTRTPITKISFNKRFSFANIEAASEFEDQRARFFAEQEMFDEFIEMREGLELTLIGTFNECMVAYRDVDQWSWYSSRLFFWLMSSLVLSWPLRILIEYKTSYVHYTITKIFGTNYELDPSRQTDLDTHFSDTLPPVTISNYSWVDDQSIAINPTARLNQNTRLCTRLSNASTVDSLELFAAIRENCALVPSYSEATRIAPQLPKDPQENDSEEGNLNSTEQQQVETIVGIDGRRSSAITIGTYSNSDLAREYIADNGLNQQNRHSWAGVLKKPGQSACQMLDDMRPQQRVNYQSINAEPRHTTTRNCTRTLIFATELPLTCSRDPYRGRQQTTPVDEPPTYEKALTLPTVRKLTRSNSGTEIAGPRRGFLRDIINNRLSCLEGVGALSAVQEVRIPLDEEGEETAL